MTDESAEAAPGGDLELARAVISGDEAAFAELYRRYARPVHDYALGIVRDRSLAEDVAQTTFLRAFEQRTSVRDPAAMRGWLYRIAHNAAVNQVSRAMRTDELPEDVPLTAPGPGPEQVAERDEAVALVWDAAASLEARQFTVLDLALRKGLSSAEIGTVLGLDSGQASLALHRAREALGNAVRYLVVARRRRHCERLAELVPAGVRTLSAEQRASVDRHIRRCAECQRVAFALTAPGELFAAIPLVALPLGLLEWRAAPAQALAAQPVADTSHVAPPHPGASRHLLTGAAGGAVVVAALVTAVFVATRHDPAPRHVVVPIGAPSSSTPAAAAVRGRMVFTTGPVNHIVTSEIDADGRNALRLSLGGVTCCSGAVLSPDNTRLVFAGEGVIAVGHADGSAAHNIWTAPVEVASVLAWSPTGRQIAFSANTFNTTGTRSVIYVMNQDGSGLRRLAEGLNVHALAWSPDGRHLAFTQNQGGIWVVATAGGPVRVLFGPSQGEGTDELPGDLSWAPASTVLFSAIGHTQPAGIWAFNPDGTGARLVLARGQSPSWGPDGSHFAAVLDGRIVIATVRGVQNTIGPFDVRAVHWAGT